MTEWGSMLGGVLIGGVVGFALCIGLFAVVNPKERVRRSGSRPVIAKLLRAHFKPASLDDLSISERKFPYRVRADLQRAVDRIFSGDTKVLHFSGIRKDFEHGGITFASCIAEDGHDPAVSTPPRYEDIDIGEESPVASLKNGLWLLERGGVRFAVLLTPADSYSEVTALRFEFGTPNTPKGTELVRDFFRQLEEAVSESGSYRGKILSLEKQEEGYSGESAGIMVHKLRQVERDDVILPRATLDLLDRNVVRFVKQRERLSQFRQSTRKGLLFHGPPGTGKTHTIHYLTRSLEGHTTLLISAEQVGLLGEYMTLARLLQPSIVVMEDVDLIARHREQMGGCEEVMLNKLLNEMDGLKEDADILFILTTNRPEALEAALASRPGRIDQAIEFPLPDKDGRRKLVCLYARDAKLSEEVTEEIVRRTEGVSAAFIKELMRRAVQCHIERDNGGDEISADDVKEALDEMLTGGGLLNQKLLGFAAQT